LPIVTKPVADQVSKTCAPGAALALGSSHNPLELLINSEEKKSCDAYVLRASGRVRRALWLPLRRHPQMTAGAKVWATVFQRRPTEAIWHLRSSVSGVLCRHRRADDSSTG